MTAASTEESALVGCQQPEASSLNRSYGGFESEDSRLPLSYSVSCEAGNTTKRRSLSNVAAAMHLLKGSLGTGVLNISRAIKLTGLLLGPIGVVAICSLAVFCIYLLSRCGRVLCERYKMAALDYGDVAYESSKGFSKTAATHLKRSVNFFLIMSQIGFCCTYVLFIAEHLVAILRACGVSLDSLTRVGPERVIIVCLVIPLVLTSLIPSLDKLSFLSITANLVLFFGLCVVWQFTAFHLNLDLPEYGGPVKDLPLVASAGGWPLFFGTVVSSFECIGVVLPTENKMKYPTAFPKVLLAVMTVVLCINVATGLLGYMCFGENTRAVLTLSLPSAGSGSWVSAVVQLYFSFIAYVTFLIEFYVLMTVVEPTVLKWAKRRWPARRSIVTSCALRIGLVVLCVAAVMAIPQLSLFIPLVGSVGCGALAFVFPPVIFLLTFSSSLAKRGYLTATVVAFLLILITCFGVVGSVFGVYSSIRQIVVFYNSGRDVRPSVLPHTVYSNNVTV